MADGRADEGKRRAFHVGRQPAHAGLTESPIDDAGGWTARLGDFERPGKLTDHELRVIDLDGDQSEGELELQRGRALELEAGAAAAHFDAKRIAADRLGRAILRSAGLPLGLAA